jgi:hypothetical protein
MPTKKKAAAEEPTAEEKAVASEDRGNQPIGPDPFTTRSGVDMLPADREILQRPIDERMDALLEDHKRMGVR